MQERYRYGLVAQHRRGKTAQSTRQMHSEDDFHEFKFGTQSTRQMHSEDDFHEFKFGLVAEHWRGKYAAKTTLFEYAFLVCNRFKRIQTVSNGIMSQPTGDKNYARAL